MAGTRVLTLAIAALVGITAAVAAGPASAEDPGGTPQTITITSTPPEHAIFDRINAISGYEPTATSTSGLPVTFTVAPESFNAAICYSMPGVIGVPGSEVDRITVAWNQPGVCKLYADQPGDEQYAPAPRVVQTFVIHKEISHLDAAPATKGLLGLTGTTFKATLLAEYRFGPGIGTGPMPNATISFSVGGRHVCSAVTNLDGVATCKAPVGLLTSLVAKSYKASYAGGTYLDPATATGALAP